MEVLPEGLVFNKDGDVALEQRAVGGFDRDPVPPLQLVQDLGDRRVLEIDFFLHPGKNA